MKKWTRKGWIATFIATVLDARIGLNYSRITDEAQLSADDQRSLIRLPILWDDPVEEAELFASWMRMSRLIDEIRVPLETPYAAEPWEPIPTPDAVSIAMQHRTGTILFADGKTTIVPDHLSAPFVR